MVGLVFKVIGGAIIVLASASIGAVLARKCSSRVYDLRALQSCLKQFENEVVFISNPVPEAFLKISHNTDSPVSAIFKDTAVKLNERKGITAYDAWTDSIRKNLADCSFNNEDVSIIADFGKMLGSSDRNGQVSNIELTVEKLKMQESKAEEVRRRYEAMYRKLGILAGLAVVVLLL